MSDQLADNTLHDCKHCAGTGTCTSGQDGCSCMACAKTNDLSFWLRSNQYGLACGTCGGLGKAELMTNRLQQRITPMLAIFFPFALVFLIVFISIYKPEVFTEVLTFSSTIIGSIIGFYFSNNKG